MSSSVNFLEDRTTLGCRPDPYFLWVTSLLRHTNPLGPRGIFLTRQRSRVCPRSRPSSPQSLDKKERPTRSPGMTEPEHSPRDRDRPLPKPSGTSRGQGPKVRLGPPSGVNTTPVHPLHLRHTLRLTSLGSQGLSP